MMQPVKGDAQDTPVLYALYVHLSQDFPFNIRLTS